MTLCFLATFTFIFDSVVVAAESRIDAIESMFPISSVLFSSYFQYRAIRSMHASRLNR